MQAATGKVGEVCAQELDKDWTLQLLVSQDRLAAYLKVELNGDGKQCPPARVLDFVQKCAVQMSPQEQAALPGIAASVSQGSKQPLLIATGQAPRAATRSIKWYVSMASPRTQETARGASVDTREVSHFVSATAGQPLCQLLATAAVDGRSVFGEAIPVPPPPKGTKEAPAMKLGKGVALAADGTTAVAQLDGSVELESGTLTVARVLNVRGNVDFKIGNVDFNGDVAIAGDVLPGFKVKATGDVRVGGVVERASIEASGQILVRGGVAGRHSANLKAGGNIEARYLHMIAVDSGESVTITSECLESHVSADRDVVVEQGAIIGGSVRARGNVRAAILGSEMGVPTIIVAGRDSVAHKELTAARKALKSLMDAVNNDRSAVQLLESQPLPPGKVAMLEVLKRQLSQREEEVNTQRTLVAELLATYAERAGQVEVKRKVYGNVTIRIGDYTRIIATDQDGPLIFYPDVENGTLAVRSK
jgi:uncharacterized protein (DUF342 family)